MPSNISGRSNTTIYLNTISGSLPLNFITNNSSSSTINLGGLNSYGGAGKVMKINSSNDGLEWGDETTIYTEGTNISISDINAISSDQKTTITFNIGEKLKGTGSLIRDIAFTNSANDCIIGDARNNVGFSTLQGLFMNGNTTALITNGRVANFSGLKMLNGNVIDFNSDTINTIGSNTTVDGVIVQGSNNVKLQTATAGRCILNVGSTAILCKGKITGQTLSNSTSRDLLQMTSTTSIHLGDINANMKFLCMSGIYLNLLTDPVLTNTGIANLTGLKMVNGSNTIDFASDTFNTIKSDSSSAGIEIKGFNNIKLYTNVANKPVLNIGQSAIKCKGKLTGEFLTGATERDLLQLTQNNSIQLGDVNTNIKYVCSGGLYMNSVVNPMLRANGTANLQGLTMDTGDINMVCPNKINFNSDIYNYINCDNNVGGTGFGGINVIGYNAVKLGTSAGNTGSLIINGQKLEVVGDLHTSNDIYCDAKYRILSSSPVLPFPETQYDNYINYGVGYATGPDIHGFRGVKLWARDATTNADDIRFYVSSGVCNMRVPQALVNGSVVQTSDDRLKTDEINFTFNSLDILNRMKPKQYKKYNEDGEFLYMELGMVAQETWNSVKDIELLRDIFVNKIDYGLESNFKENGDLVEDQQKTNDKGEIITNYLYVNYISYIPILIQSIKDLNLIVKQQQEQINSLLTSKV